MRGPRHSLDPLFHPEAAAVIGASSTPGAVGSILIRNLTQNPYTGLVYPINPRRRAVHGIHCLPRVQDVPEPVDLAIIATPAATVPGIVRECVDAGIPGAIIVSAGFAELGEEGRKLEHEILGITRGRMRVIGPNCLGVIHPPSGFNVSFAATTPSPGRIALLSQSGAICTSILDWSREVHTGFSSFISVGSMIDVDFADLIDYFADDPHTEIWSTFRRSTHRNPPSRPSYTRCSTGAIKSYAMKPRKPCRKTGRPMASGFATFSTAQGPKAAGS